MDPRRHEARLKLSSKDSALPILVVEGKQDYQILHQRWNSGPETLRASIKIQYPSGEHTKNGVLDELRKNSENPKYHGMVDMDHDFEKRELIGHPRTYDTSPLVTFPTYAFRDKDDSCTCCEKYRFTVIFWTSQKKLYGQRKS